MVVHSKKSENIILKQILDAIVTIESDIQGIHEDEFLDNHTVVRACLIMLVHIAELIFKAKKVRPDYQFIDDAALRGMRNIIAHDYLSIRGTFLRQAVYHKLPLLKEKSQHYLHLQHEDYTAETITIQP